MPIAITLRSTVIPLHSPEHAPGDRSKIKNRFSLHTKRPRGPGDGDVECDVLLHDGDPVCVLCKQLRVAEAAYQDSFCCLLERLQSLTLEPDFGAAVLLCHSAHETRERVARDDAVGVLLHATDLTVGHHALARAAVRLHRLVRDRAARDHLLRDDRLARRLDSLARARAGYSILDACHIFEGRGLKFHSKKSDVCII